MAKMQAIGCLFRLVLFLVSYNAQGYSGLQLSLRATCRIHHSNRDSGLFSGTGEQVDLSLDDWELRSANSDEDVINLDNEELFEEIHDEVGTSRSNSTADQQLRDFTIAVENLDTLPNASNVAYFYLQNELGMLPEDMWKITYEAGNALGLTAANLRKKVDLLRRTMDLNDEDLRTIIRLHPTILYMSADKNLAPTILFLQRELDLSREDLKSLVTRRPYTLSYSIPNLSGKIKFFKEVMSFTVDEIRKLILKDPRLMSCGVKGGLFPRMKFFIDEIEFTMTELRELVLKNPSLLLLSVEQNLQPKLIFFFIMTLGMDTAMVRKVMKRYPNILVYKLDSHVLPIARFLTSEVQFTKNELRQIVIKFPRLLAWSVKKIKYVVGYLRFELGMDADKVRRILYQAPQVVSLSMEENLKPKVEYLRKTFDCDAEVLRKVISGMPTLLICSLEKNIKPKIEYLEDILGKKELRQTVQVHPSLLGYSLEKRIKPRMQVLLEAGAHPRAIGLVIMRSDKDFVIWMEGKRDRLKRKPGYDQTRRVRNEDGILLPETYERKNSWSDDGRITYWNRNRKPPS